MAYDCEFVFCERRLATGHFLDHVEHETMVYVGKSDLQASEAAAEIMMAMYELCRFLSRWIAELRIN